MLSCQFKASSKCYIKLFKKESLVYLTADSPNTITQLSRDKVRPLLFILMASVYTILY